MRKLAGIGTAVVLIICGQSNAQITTGEVPIQTGPTPQQPPGVVVPGQPVPQQQPKPGQPQRLSGLRMSAQTKGKAPATGAAKGKSVKIPQISARKSLEKMKPTITETKPENFARISYKDVLGIAQNDANQKADARVYMLRIVSRIGATPEDIKLQIESKDIPMVLPINESGYFQLPYSKDLETENPTLVANQPKGSLQILYTVGGNAKAPNTDSGSVAYKDLLQPLITINETIRKNDPNFGQGTSQQLAVAIEVGAGKQLQIKRASSVRTLNADKNGKVYMVFESVIFDENPVVLVPPSSRVEYLPVTPDEVERILAQ